MTRSTKGRSRTKAFLAVILAVLLSIAFCCAAFAQGDEEDAGTPEVLEPADTEQIVFHGKFVSVTDDSDIGIIGCVTLENAHSLPNMQFEFNIVPIADTDGDGILQKETYDADGRPLTARIYATKDNTDCYWDSWINNPEIQNSSAYTDAEKSVRRYTLHFNSDGTSKWENAFDGCEFKKPGVYAFRLVPVLPETSYCRITENRTLYLMVSIYPSVIYNDTVTESGVTKTVTKVELEDTSCVYWESWLQETAPEDTVWTQVDDSGNTLQEEFVAADKTFLSYTYTGTTVEVVKTVTGNGADKSHLFDFNIAVKDVIPSADYFVAFDYVSPNLAVPNTLAKNATLDSHLTALAAAENAQRNTDLGITGVQWYKIRSTSNGTLNLTCKLGHNDNVFIDGLPSSAVVTVSEENEDYEPAYKVNGGAEVKGDTATNVSAENPLVVTFTNTNNFSVQTGVSIAIAPAVAALLASAVLLPINRKKKTNREGKEE